MSLETSPEIENVVRERAAVEGLSVNELLARALASDESAKAAKSDPAASVKALLAGGRPRMLLPLRHPSQPYRVKRLRRPCFGSGANKKRTGRTKR